MPEVSLLGLRAQLGEQNYADVGDHLVLQLR